MKGGLQKIKGLPCKKEEGDPISSFRGREMKKGARVRIGQKSYRGKRKSSGL